LVCHKKKRTLSLEPGDVAAHLSHGDTLGACPPGAEAESSRIRLRERRRRLTAQ